MKSLHQHGFTMTELLIGTAIALIVLTGVSVFYVTTIKTSGESLKIAKLNQYMRSVMSVMVNDIRRAGYWYDPEPNPSIRYGVASGANPNPFMFTENDISIGEYDGEAKDSCILYSYDLNKSGYVGVGDIPNPDNTVYDKKNNERFGFRLKDKAIQMRKGGSQYDCNKPGWENISDDIEITDLRFLRDTDSALHVDADASIGSQILEIRKITIDITGRLISDPSISRTISETVRVRNDKF